MLEGSAVSWPSESLRGLLVASCFQPLATSFAGRGWHQRSGDGASKSLGVPPHHSPWRRLLRAQLGFLALVYVPDCSAGVQTRAGTLAGNHFLAWFIPPPTHLLVSQGLFLINFYIRILDSVYSWENRLLGDECFEDIHF